MVLTGLGWVFCVFFFRQSGAYWFGLGFFRQSGAYWFGFGFFGFF